MYGFRRLPVNHCKAFRFLRWLSRMSIATCTTSRECLFDALISWTTWFTTGVYMVYCVYHHQWSHKVVFYSTTYHLAAVTLTVHTVKFKLRSYSNRMISRYYGNPVLVHEKRSSQPFSCYLHYGAYAWRRYRVRSPLANLINASCGFSTARSLYYLLFA